MYITDGSIISQKKMKCGSYYINGDECRIDDNRNGVDGAVNVNVILDSGNLRINKEESPYIQQPFVANPYVVQPNILQPSMVQPSMIQPTMVQPTEKVYENTQYVNKVQQPNISNEQIINKMIQPMTATNKTKIKYFYPEFI